MTDLQAAAARADITPPPGVRLVGYLDRDVPADRVNDRLTATAVALRDPGGDALLMVCCDVLGFPLRLSSQIRASISQACGVPARSVWLAPSHTHSGPPTYTGQYATPVEDEWIEQLPQRLVAVAAEAWSALRPATMRVATCSSAIGVNRRVLGPDGRVSEMAEAYERPVDHRVLALQFEVVDGGPIACLVNVGCHPVVCGRDTLYVTADYPGALRTALEAAGTGLCAFTLGACGDVNPLGGIHADPSHAQAIGRRVATDVLAALESAEPAAPLPLRVAQAAPAVRYADVDALHIEHLTGAAGLAPAALTEMVDRRFPWTSPLDDSGTLEVELLVARLGDTMLAAVPYEVFAATGFELLTKLGPDGATVTLANAATGYLPPADEIPRGGYEVDESFLFYRLPGPPPATAESDVVAAIARLAEQLSSD